MSFALFAPPSALRAAAQWSKAPARATSAAGSRSSKLQELQTTCNQDQASPAAATDRWTISVRVGGGAAAGATTATLTCGGMPPAHMPPCLAPPCRPSSSLPGPWRACNKCCAHWQRRCARRGAGRPPTQRSSQRRRRSVAPVPRRRQGCSMPSPSSRCCPRRWQTAWMPCWQRPTCGAACAAATAWRRCRRCAWRGASSRSATRRGPGCRPWPGSWPPCSSTCSCRRGCWQSAAPARPARGSRRGRCRPAWRAARPGRRRWSRRRRK